MRISRLLGIALCLSTLCTATEAREDLGPKPGEKPTGVVGSAWQVARDSASVTLATFDGPSGIKTTLTDDTRIEGVCVHCEIDLQCRAADLAKRCAACPCERSNILCLAGKSPTDMSWHGLLLALPRGTRMRLEFIDTDKPEKGIKRLIVDRRGAVVPVEGLSSATPEQLQSIGKTIGAARLQRNVQGNRLQVSTRDNWTSDKEARLERELAKIGAKLAFPQDH